VYQGEELGLWEVEDLPDEDRQDPMWQRSGHANLGRDGCRVPLPWSGDQPPFGFLASENGSSDQAEVRTWLPQPPAWSGLTVEAEAADPDSMLSLYRHALAVRHREPAFATDSFTWLPGPAGVLCFRRGTDVTVMINVSDSPADLLPHEEILAASYRPVGGVLPQTAVSEGVLPPDAAVWLRTEPAAA
jgi:alpha-glucosidase